MVEAGDHAGTMVWHDVTNTDTAISPRWLSAIDRLASKKESVD
jgi:hypothetical protein